MSAFLALPLRSVLSSTANAGAGALAITALVGIGCGLDERSLSRAWEHESTQDATPSVVSSAESGSPADGQAGFTHPWTSVNESGASSPEGQGAGGASGSGGRGDTLSAGGGAAATGGGGAASSGAGGNESGGAATVRFDSGTADPADASAPSDARAGDGEGTGQEGRADGGAAGPDSSDEGGLPPGLPEAASPDAASPDAGTGGVQVLTVAGVIRDLHIDSSSVFFLADGSIRSCNVQGCPGGPSTVQTQVTGNYFALANGLLVFTTSQERTVGGRYYDDLTVSVAGNSSLKFVLQSANPGVSIVGFASSSSDVVYSYHALGPSRTFVGRCALPTPQGCTSQSTILSDVEPAQLLPTSSTLFVAGTLGDAGSVGFYAIPITATDGLASSLGFGPVSSRRYFGYAADLYVYTPFSPPQYCSGGAGGCSVPATPPTIAKCSATGCPGGPIKIATAPPSASEFVVDESGYYYIDSGKIWSGKGSSAPTAIETGLTTPTMLRVTDQHLFWVENSAAGSQIRRVAKP